eukprot:7687320-Pyramimonas_sp.AAC.1
MATSGELKTTVCDAVVVSSAIRAGIRARAPLALAPAAVGALALLARGPQGPRPGEIIDLTPHRGGIACGWARLRGRIVQKRIQQTRYSALSAMMPMH